MTREQAKQNLISIGFEEPTEEQVTKYLNQVNGETKTERERADGYKKEAEKVADLQNRASTKQTELQNTIAELQSQLDEINSQNLSDVEKANKATADAEKATQAALDKVADLEKQISRMNTLKSLADKGITGEDAENLIDENGVVNFETLGKIISEREAAAATAKEQEIAKASTNPGGGSSGGEKPGNEKPDDVTNAEQISFGSMNNNAQAARDYYK